MLKKYYQMKVKIGVVIAHIFSLMLAVGIFCFSLSQCLLITSDVELRHSNDGTVFTANGKQIGFMNPFESEAKYDETDVFEDAFETDASFLISYLAICGQFENEGMFDPNKEVDVFSYYCRKDPSFKIDSKGAFTYKVQDLITWVEAYGFTSEDGYLLNEIFLPVDGKSISEKEEQLYNLVMQVNNKLQIPHTNVLAEEENLEESVESDLEIQVMEEADVDETDVNNVEVDEIYSTETEVEETDAEEIETEETEMDEAYEEESEANVSYTESSVSTERKDDYIIVTSLGGKDKNEESVLSMEEARSLYYEILSKVASDLLYNYTEYQHQKDYLNNCSNNFKYLYISEESQNYYTNLKVKNWTDAQSKMEYFDDKLAAYAIIDAKNGNIEAKSNNVLTSNILSYLNIYKYAFSNGGKLYIGVLDDTVNGFAEYTSDDNYAQIKDFSLNNRMNMKLTIGWLMFLILLSFVLLAINTILCGRSSEDDEIHLMAFDDWYTEIAAGFSCAIVVILALGLYLLAYVIDGGSNSFIYQFFHDNYFLMLMIVYVALADGCFLFFYDSFIRRIKAKRLWTGSLLYNMIKGSVSACKNFAVGSIILFGKASILGKTVLTFLQVLFLVILHVSAIGTENGLLFLLAFFFDVAFFLLMLYVNVSRNKIIEGIEKISGGDLEYQMEINHMYGDSLRWTKAVNNIGKGIREAVNQSMRDERMKADLITNVSHDIKTPLTSIINYVDLLKRENVQDEKIQGYIEILDNKSQRLKQLTEDLVEASKISSGNIVLNIEELNVKDLMKQALGEFDDKFESRNLKVVESYSENPCIIRADSRRMWRVVDNLLGNVYKYALENTRVYVEVKELVNQEQKVSISIKNISQQALNIDADELTERFIRGDISRSTEGSGLGLSIAKNLVEAQGGIFRLYLDGDLFKATILF